MKNFKRNTLIYDFIGAAFCLVMAFALLMIYTGCSEDVGTSPVAHEGGYTEEQASLENIKVVAHARRFISSDDSSANELISSVVPGSVIKLSELDSISFDTTGVSYFSRTEDSFGIFSFDSVSLKSPYVMLELAPYKEDGYWEWDGIWSFKEYDEDEGRYMVTYRVVVDLRKSKEVNINVVTHLESFRLFNLIKQGKTFAEAKLQADREMLDALGIYGTPYRFDKPLSAENRDEMIFADYLGWFIEYWLCDHPMQQMADVFGDTGFLNSSDSVKKFFANEIYRELREGVVRNEYSITNYLENFMASLFGLGQCTAEREGFSAVEPLDNYRNMKFICQAGKWSFSVNYNVSDNLDASFGQMTDSRDGSKYKTVTYNISGGSQTWLAENLKYKSADGYYTWQGAMNLPDSVALVSYEDCIEENSYTDCDRMQAEKNNLDYERLWAITDSVKAAGKKYQGMCPDGWHLPDADEWKKLRDYVAEKIDVGSLRNLDVMAMAGFESVDLEKLRMYAVKLDRSFNGMENNERVKSTIIMVYDKDASWSYISREDKNWIMKKRRNFLEDGPLSVRCVKD